MHAAEPVTMLTDYALAAVSLAFAWRVGRAIGPRNRVSAWFWCGAFLAAAAAGIAGGTYHGVTGPAEGALRHGLWTLVAFAAGACGAFVTAGIHAADVRWQDGTVQWLAAGIAVTIAGAVVQQFGLPAGVPIGHNDAYHVIQILGLYALFRCARTVHDRAGVDNPSPPAAAPRA
jgi:hypothetical protein